MILTAKYSARMKKEEKEDPFNISIKVWDTW
jgi:hypothetical protein